MPPAELMPPHRGAINPDGYDYGHWGEAARRRPGEVSMGHWAILAQWHPSYVAITHSARSSFAIERDSTMLAPGGSVFAHRLISRLRLRSAPALTYAL